MIPTRRRLRWAAAAAASLLLLTACSSQPADDAAQQSEAAMPSAPADLGKYYSQDVDWTSCSTQFECAEVEVPLDYEQPDQKSIDLSVIKLKASGKKQGTLLVNPGGPGGSGVDLVEDAGTLIFSADLRSGYDLVGFDPRGVSRSAPVSCRTDAQRDADRTLEIDPDTKAGLKELEEESKEYARDCAERSGASLGHVDTISSAKDLDILRAISDAPKLDYLGFSYGTKLGATYADLFPSHVGHMVLD
ncbi:MAG: alpha/beta hydrolase, partial [Micrococcaceae bacterium]|nr:alpha/beta hydrolase [Micrococcaceae bacterium]